MMFYKRGGSGLKKHISFHLFHLLDIIFYRYLPINKVLVYYISFYFSIEREKEQENSENQNELSQRREEKRREDNPN